MGDFLAFRKMIATYFIQVIFWIGLVAIVVFSVGAISQDQALAGLLVLIFGTLYWRIACEFLIVFFRMHSTLTAIKADTSAIPPALASGGWTPEGGGTPRAESATAVTAAPSITAAAATVASTSPEGWYDDSTRPGHTRWWDGTAWGIRDDEHPAVASESPPADTEIAAPSAESPPLTEQVTDDTATAVEPSAEDADTAPASSSAPESAPSPKRFCENCGAERSPEARFCTSCGHA